MLTNFLDNPLARTQNLLLWWSQADFIDAHVGQKGEECQVI